MICGHCNWSWLDYFFRSLAPLPMVLINVLLTFTQTYLQLATKFQCTSLSYLANLCVVNDISFRNFSLCIVKFSKHEIKTHVKIEKIKWYCKHCSTTSGKIFKDILIKG